jgi:hypothetical protein
MISHEYFEDRADPIDLIEKLAQASDLESQRVDDSEVHVCVTGSWRDVSLWFSYRKDVQILQVGVPLELKVPEARRDEVLKLLAMINERLWLGHFDLWGDEQEITYRNGSVLGDGFGLEPRQAETLLKSAFEAFERYYPAFNFVVWGGRSAKDAMAAAILDTVGEA